MCGGSFRCLCARPGVRPSARTRVDACPKRSTAATAPSPFADVIGQDHVTEPLQQALPNDRIHHAYLFSGPRGCGKTTSARILARCLNCEQGPTPTPCGDLPLLPGPRPRRRRQPRRHRDRRRQPRRGRRRARPAGAGVLRPGLLALTRSTSSTRRTWSPARASTRCSSSSRSRRRHVKFVFATTEPDKVIATIRSRTHHYPFRLVPPGELQAYLLTGSARTKASPSSEACCRWSCGPGAARSATR